MEVLLTEDVKKLGHRGEIVDVAPGYARNYLLPQALATAATKQSRRQFEARRRSEEHQRELRREEFEQTAKDLEKMSCTVVAKANPEGHLFGSVNAAAIVKAFKDVGVELAPSSIILDEPFKEEGVYTVEVRLAPDITATTRVWIVGKQS